MCEKLLGFLNINKNTTCDVGGRGGNRGSRAMERAIQWKGRVNTGSFETGNMSHFRNCLLKNGIK